MWLVVRANAVVEAPDGMATLAASPDSGERDATWRWSVVRLRDASGALEVVAETDPAHVVAETAALTLEEGAPMGLHRVASEVVVLAALAGRHLVGRSDGPWHCWLAAGDVLVVEGDGAESLRLTGVDGPARVTVVRLTTTGGGPLRWAP